jgi:hypothetical protein
LEQGKIRYARVALVCAGIAAVTTYGLIYSELRETPALRYLSTNLGIQTDNSKVSLSGPTTVKGPATIAGHKGTYEERLAFDSSRGKIIHTATFAADGFSLSAVSTLPPLHFTRPESGKLTGEWRNISVSREDDPIISQMLDPLRISCKLNADLKISDQDGQLSGDLTLSAVTSATEEAMIDMDGNGMLRLKLGDGKVVIEKSEFTSSLLTARISGNVALSTDLWQSPLDVSVNLTTAGDLDFLSEVFSGYRQTDGSMLINIVGTVLQPMLSTRGSGSIPSPPATDNTATPPALEIIPEKTIELRMNPKAIEKLLGDGFSRAMMSARLVPSIRDGSMYGFKIIAIQKNSLFDRTGFKNGDIIAGIDGRLLSSPEAGFKIFQAFEGSMRTFVIDILRNDKPIRLKFSYKEPPAETK